MEILLFILIGLGLSTYFIVKRGTNVTKKDVIRKGLASAIFVMAGITNYGINRNPFTLLFCFGLIMGFCGDIVLDYKYCCKEEDSNNFLLMGFGFFAAGHLFYTTALCSNNSELYFGVITILVATITGIAVALLEKPMKMNYGDVKPAVVIYSGVLTLPLTTSVLNLIKNPDTTNVLFVIAFAVFLFSDLILSGIYFGNKNNKKNIAFCHILYYAAQYLIVITVALTRPVLN